MAELTKSNSRQPIGRIKSTDKMVMMPSLFAAQNQPRLSNIMRGSICI